ncbi:MAG: hypothetical protein Q8O30_07850 [Candidatus Omnitrophota bacterium]|nr:hypothetical protein [Candidatus Omnitrophota bacterium]
MKKKRIFVSFISVLIILSISCAPTPPTYSRQDIEKIIKELCKKEFNIGVKVWEAGDTIWVYAPFENPLDEKGTWSNEKISKDIERIYLSLSRVILSMDKRPKFYCFLVSDIRNGFDIYTIWFIRDLMMYHTEFISRGEFSERRVAFIFTNPQAIDDKEGKHVHGYDISMGEFISYLIKQSIEIKFASDEVKDNFVINEVKTNYDNGRLKVQFDIMTKKYKKGFDSPLEEIEKIMKKFLKIYQFPPEIKEIVISDIFNKTSRFYTRQELIAKKK